MFFNYIKLAIRVLARNKFFTAITLFGISFTLAILMLIVSVMETEVGETKPLSERARFVLLPTLEIRKMYYDTIYTIDTSIMDGVVTLDSTYRLEKAGKNNSGSQFSIRYLERHLSNIPSAENYTFFNSNNTFNTYVHNTKIEMKAIYADHRFWEVFDFEFIEGFGFSQSSVTQQEPVAVITTDLAEKYFGRVTGVLGKKLEMDGVFYTIMGVVKPAGVTLLAVDIVVPHTLLRSADSEEEIGFGGFMAVYVADSPNGIKRVKDDIAFVNRGLEVHPSVQEYYNEVVLQAWTYHELYAAMLLNLDDDDTTDRSLSALKKIMLGLIVLFVLLPVLNLINLNVGRIFERSAEIGVRKAFGACQSTILSQFVVENIIQTILGGILGMGLAIWMIYLINDAKLMGDIALKLNPRFFMYSIIITVLFGVLSGLLPAYRMSKLHVVNALKQNKI